MVPVLTNLLLIWRKYAGFCICDDEVCCEASKQEIIRRYYQALNRLAKEDDNSDEVTS